MASTPSRRNRATTSRLAGRGFGSESSDTKIQSGSRVWAAMDASARSASRRGRFRVATTAAIGGIMTSRLSPNLGCGRALKRSEPAGIRTQDTRIKSPVLWPTELPAHKQLGRHPRSSERGIFNNSLVSPPLTSRISNEMGFARGVVQTRARNHAPSETNESPLAFSPPSFPRKRESRERQALSPMMG